MASYTVAILCPYCQSDAVVKNGQRYGKQVYRCNGCRKQFKNTGATNGHRMPADHIGAAIQDYYAGKSYKQIAGTMALEYDIPDAVRLNRAGLNLWMALLSRLLVCLKLSEPLLLSV